MNESLIHILPATELINCGRRDVQAQYRLNLQRICKAEDINVGDTVEVWIKKIDKEE
jgi:hypothetical protein